ncbi:MAG: DUF5658 family protein [Phycisphaerales bacterium]|nr:DUF5658 family protein [Phycisphaerales bacterium]
MEQVAIAGTASHAASASLAVNNRRRRVTVLVLGIIVLSLGDLAITLKFLEARWMIEANPIAAYVIESTQSAWVLVAFKCVTVGICAALLLRLRRHAAGEMAAWFGMAVLVAVLAMWHSYSSCFDGMEDVLLVHADAGEGMLGLP